MKMIKVISEIESEFAVLAREGAVIAKLIKEVPENEEVVIDMYGIEGIFPFFLNEFRNDWERIRFINCENSILHILSNKNLKCEKWGY
jgi:hypothetical protein